MVKIENVMQHPVFIDRHATVKDTIKKMVEDDVCCIVVGGSQEHYGIVSERMILDKLAEDDSTLSTPVSELIKYQPICIKKDKTVHDALSVMKENKIRHLCVENNGEIVGCIDARTIMANTR